RIYRTADGGAHWTLQFETREKGAFLDGMAFADAHHGFALGDPVGGRLFVLATRDGGRHWSRVQGLPDPLPGEAAFAASGTAIAVRGTFAWLVTGGGALARCGRSSDGGATWRFAETPVPGGETSGLFSVAFA